MTHPANIRRLLRDMGCMMSVPSTCWSAARCCCRPLRSSSQPWEIEKSSISLLPSDLVCLDTGNRIMRAVIKLARQCHRHNVPWAIENPEKSFCWNTQQLEALSKMRNVHKMTFDFCALGTKWRKLTTVLVGHVDSADVSALNRMRCYGRTRCTVTDEKHLQFVGYDFSHQCSRVNRAKTYPTKLAGRLAHLLLGPNLTARIQRTCYDLGMQWDR